MRRWMQTAPLKRAYTVSTFGYTLPLLIFAIAIVLIVHSTAVAPTNELVTQAEAGEADLHVLLVDHQPFKAGGAPRQGLVIDTRGIWAR